MSSTDRPSWSKTVYRLRGFPNNFTHDDLSQSIQQAHHIQPADFKIHSLSLDLEEGDLPRRKVATITFRKPPLATLCPVEDQLWNYEAASHPSNTAETYRAYLSSRLDGLTPLTPEQNDETCDTDCIFVHGWGGNPIGSLIADDPNYVWLRDDITQRFPRLRVWTYGYGSRLDDPSHVSEPFEYALRLKDALRAFRRSSRNRPMVFLVHSLGGIILKQMIVSMSKSSNVADQSNLRLIKGALLFGVPGQGMDTEALANMVQGLPSQYIANFLDENMGFRQREALDEDLYSVIQEYHLKLYCFFEMRKTPTVAKKPDGTGWTRSGKPSLLVKPASATFKQHDQNHTSHVISLDKDHSGLIKFSRNDSEDYFNVCSVLNELIQMENDATQLQSAAPSMEEQQTFDLQQKFIDGLYAHVLQSRTRQISEAATGTYEWIFPYSENVTTNSDYSDVEMTSGEDSDDKNRSDGGVDLEFQTSHEYHASVQSDTSEFSSWKDHSSEDASIGRQGGRISGGSSQATYPDTGFLDWLLQDSSEIFWITGKPGSGKSTLVKFIAQHPKTGAALRRWASSEKVTIVSFYFWISGAPLQHSVIGLLQSIFHQILSHNRHLIATLFPYEWRQTQRSESVDWTEESFLYAIDCLAELERDGHRFCFFIDGLDEYEGNHNQDWLCDLLIKLGGMDHIKLCVSSRYWPIFQSAFLDCPTLKLHEWTISDVEIFVYQELEIHPLWIELTELEADRTTRLVQLISELAKGVFLWVVLTVRALVKNLVKGVTIEYLFEILRQLPKSLNGFFDRILKDLEAEDHDYVVKALLLTRNYGPSILGIPVIILSQLDMAGQVVSGRAWVRRQSPKELENRAVRTERRLTSLCSGLLIIRNTVFARDYGDLAVTFARAAELSHRTLFDYLNNPVTSQRLKLSDGSSFDAYAWLDETLVVICRILPVSVDGQGLMRLIDHLYGSWIKQFRRTPPRTFLPDQQYYAELNGALVVLFKTAVLGSTTSETEISITDLMQSREAESYFWGLNLDYLDTEDAAYERGFSAWMRGNSIADIVKDTLESGERWKE